VKPDFTFELDGRLMWHRGWCYDMLLGPGIIINGRLYGQKE
jgi:hypothetical protein